MKLRNKLSIVGGVLNAHIFRKKIPLIVTFAVTYRCNSHCLYCNFWNTKCRELTTKQIFSLIDELGELGTQRIGFTGGEPLVREDIGEIINYSKRKGIFTGLNSNGFLVSEKIKEIRNVDTLHLSFDGPQEIHDKLKGRGMYKKLMEGIKTAKKYRIPLTTTTVLTRYNIKLDCIDFILEKAREFEFYIYFQPVNAYPHASPNALSLFPPEREYKKVIKKLIEEKNNNRYIGNSLSCLRYLYDYPVHKKKIKCWAGDLHVRIEANGDLIPCYETKCKKILNIKDDEVKRAFQNLSKISCEGCWCHANIEYNYLFSLDINAVKNALKFLNFVSFS